jgi:DNA-binding XRE family transcriptional regulator
VSIDARIAELERQLRDAKRERRLGGPKDEPGGALYWEVGIAIRRKRELLGMSQEELANRAGIGRTSIVNIEGGRQRLPLTTLYDIADALQVQAVQLLPRNEDV